MARLFVFDFIHFVTILMSLSFFALYTFLILCLFFVSIRIMRNEYLTPLLIHFNHIDVHGFQPAIL